jgi:protocatechuate 3,4-dioxygenase beta subunit
MTHAPTADRADHTDRFDAGRSDHADDFDHADDMDDFDRGLTHDLSTFAVQRRRLLQLVAGAGIAAVAVACGSGDDDSTTPTIGTAGTVGSTTAGTTATTAPTPTAAGATDTLATDTDASCSPIPQETAGPYPGDGSNGPNLLTESGVVRSDIRSSIGDASGVADGVPLTITLSLQDTAAGCAPFTGAAVYLWHCDREGRYSMYSAGVEDENYLRGVQEAGADGTVTFTTVFPGCYSGRWPHVHFEVYETVAAATSGADPITTSQLALPGDVCEAVYASDGYDESVDNFAQSSLQRDNVFSDDGAVDQLAAVTGGSSGYAATLDVGV